MPLRVVVDTNVWISALLNPHGPPAQVLEALKRNAFEPVLASALLDELMEVVKRPRLRRYCLRHEEIIELQNLLRDRSRWVEPTGELHLCRDPADDLLLEVALLGQAQYLVTRDDDLKRDLELIQRMEEQGIRVVSVRQFLRLLESGS